MPCCCAVAGSCRDASQDWSPADIAVRYLVQALRAVQQQSEEAGRSAQHWDGAAARLRTECAQLEALMREQRESTQQEARTFPAALPAPCFAHETTIRAACHDADLASGYSGFRSVLCRQPDPAVCLQPVLLALAAPWQVARLQAAGDAALASAQQAAAAANAEATQQRAQAAELEQHLQARRADCCWMLLHVSMVLLVTEDRGRNAVCAWQACTHKPRVTFHAQQEREQRLAAAEQAAAQQQRDSAECSDRAHAQRLEVEQAGRALQAERAELKVTTGLNPEGAHLDDVAGQALQGRAAPAGPPGRAPCALQRPVCPTMCQMPGPAAGTTPCRPDFSGVKFIRVYVSASRFRTVRGYLAHVLQQAVLSAMHATANFLPF
jgi:hypothetical protein